MDNTLAELVSLKLDNKLSLQQWAQSICDERGYGSTIGISARIRTEALLLISSDELRKRWLNMDG